MLRHINKLTPREAPYLSPLRKAFLLKARVVKLYMVISS